MIIAGSGPVSKDEKIGRFTSVAETLTGLRKETGGTVIFLRTELETIRFDFNDPVRLIKHISDVQVAEGLPPSLSCELIHTQSCRC